MVSKLFQSAKKKMKVTSRQVLTRPLGEGRGDKSAMVICDAALRFSTGHFSWADGSVYDGEFVDNDIHGRSD